MTEKREGPTQGVRFIEMSVERVDCIGYGYIL